jgi:Na+/H+-dicarboxylate symporter
MGWVGGVYKKESYLYNPYNYLALTLDFIFSSPLSDGYILVTNRCTTLLPRLYAYIHDIRTILAFRLICNVCTRHFLDGLVATGVFCGEVVTHYVLGLTPGLVVYVCMYRCYCGVNFLRFFLVWEVVDVWVRK